MIPLGTSSGDWQTGGKSIASLNAAPAQGGNILSVQPVGGQNMQKTVKQSYFQNPASIYSQPTARPTGGGVAPASGGGGMTAQQIAVQRAQAQARAEEMARETQRKALRGGISGLIDAAMRTYDTIFGNVKEAAKSQRGLLEEKYNTETEGLTEQFTQEIPKIGMSYAGRGAYDSSYRMGAEAQAQKQYMDQLKGLGTARAAEEAKIGQELQSQEANIQKERSLFDLMRQRIGEMSNIDELTQTRNELDRKIREIQATAASTGTQEAYRQRFAQIAPAASNLANLRAQLSNIIQGAANPMLKKSVAEQLIGSAGLTEEEKNQLTTEVNTQLGV